jgi:hypothetical protein
VRSILGASEPYKAKSGAVSLLNVRDLPRQQDRPVSVCSQQHCLADYDVARSLSLPSARGHPGRDSPVGATWRFADCKRPRSASAKFSTADASASRVGAISAVSSGANGADAINTGTGAVGRDAIDARTDAFTANKRWWNTITSN